MRTSYLVLPLSNVSSGRSLMIGFSWYGKMRLSSWYRKRTVMLSSTGELQRGSEAFAFRVLAVGALCESGKARVHPSEPSHTRRWWDWLILTPAMALGSAQLQTMSQGSHVHQSAWLWGSNLSEQLVLPVKRNKHIYWVHIYMVCSCLYTYLSFLRVIQDSRTSRRVCPGTVCPGEVACDLIHQPKVTCLIPNSNFRPWQTHQPESMTAMSCWCVSRQFMDRLHHFAGSCGFSVRHLLLSFHKVCFFTGWFVRAVSVACWRRLGNYESNAQRGTGTKVVLSVFFLSEITCTRIHHSWSTDSRFGFLRHSDLPQDLWWLASPIVSHFMFFASAKFQNSHFIPIRIESPTREDDPCSAHLSTTSRMLVSPGSMSRWLKLKDSVTADTETGITETATITFLSIQVPVRPVSEPHWFFVLFVSHFAFRTLRFAQKNPLFEHFQGNNHKASFAMRRHGTRGTTRAIARPARSPNLGNWQHCCWFHSRFFLTKHAIFVRESEKLSAEFSLIRRALSSEQTQWSEILRMFGFREFTVEYLGFLRTFRNEFWTAPIERWMSSKQIPVFDLQSDRRPLTQENVCCENQSDQDLKTIHFGRKCSSKFVECFSSYCCNICPFLCNIIAQLFDFCRSCLCNECFTWTKRAIVPVCQSHAFTREQRVSPANGMIGNPEI